MQYLPDSMPVVYASDNLFYTSQNIFIDENQGRLYVCGGKRWGVGSFPMRVYSLAAPLDPQFEFELTEIDRALDVYVRNDMAYVNAAEDGLWVVDYSGASPQLLNTLTSYPEQGINHSGWLTDDGNTYVFADQTPGTRLKIMDVNDINNWSIVSLIGSGVDTLSMPHNQMIRGDLLFSSYYSDGLRVFDISDPVNPLQVAWYDTYEDPQDTSSLFCGDGFAGNDFVGNWGVYCLLPSGRILASDMQSGLFVLELDNSILVGTENVEPRQLENVALWPNPSSDLINLAIPLSYKTTLRIDLYTADRRWVKTLMENTSWEAGQQQFQFNLGKDLPAGTYFIEGYTPDQGAFIKPIVIH
jgi:choice-of-anchor B domain-containing protein